MTSRNRGDEAETEAENEVDRFLATLDKEMEQDTRKAEKRAKSRNQASSLVQAVEKRRGSIPDDEVDAFLQSFFVAEEVAKAEKKFKGENEEKKGSVEANHDSGAGAGEFGGSLADAIEVEVVARLNDSAFEAENDDDDEDNDDDDGVALGGRESLGRESTRDSIDVSEFADAQSPSGRASLDAFEAGKLDIAEAVEEKEVGREEEVEEDEEQQEEEEELGNNEEEEAAAAEKEEGEKEEEGEEVQIPSGWEALRDDEGNEYFFNKENGKLVFSKEALMAQAKDTGKKKRKIKGKKKKAKKKKSKSKY